MNKANLKFFVALGTLILIGMCVVATIALYFPQKARAIYSRPLVLIHEPLNREHITLGEHALVNATARNSRGVKRIELWVNEVFYFAQEIPDGETLTTASLMVPWEPAHSGEYNLVVRAISANDVDGQASIRVQVNEPESAEQADQETDAKVEDQQTDTASAAGTAGEEVEPSDTAPSGGSASQSGGGPGSSAPSGGAPPPSEDESPPPESGSAPGSSDDISDDLGIGEPEPEPPLTEDLIQLQVEALALQTASEYESLHCYVGIAHLEPQWHPDADHDQSTDETFSSSGDGNWNVDEYLSGDQAAIFNWPGNEALPFTISCVGIVAGGTDSIPLGSVEILAEPDTWDGTTRQVESSGGEGVFTLDYRINGIHDMGFHAILDPSIPPPFDLAIGGLSDSELQWEWEPNPDLEPEAQRIDGFYINVNGTRQFVIDSPDARSIEMPPEWLMPPCGFDYTFTVQAWRWNADDPTQDDWSYDSDPYVISREDPLAECAIRADVSFDTLTIQHYGSDDIGPILLMFNVVSGGSSNPLNMDGWCRGSGPSCEGVMLNADRLYSLSDLMSMGDGNHARVPLTESDLTLFATIYAEDDSGGELVCSDFIRIPPEELFDPDGTVTEYWGTMVSDDGRCEVQFSINSEMIISSGLEHPGEVPLPQLYIDEIRTQQSNGRYWINVHNSSGAPGNPAATWLYDLDVLLTRNSGEVIDRFTIPELNLAPGEQIDIFNPENTTIDRIEDLCVTLDPDNDVLESVERRNPGWTAPPECLDIPDLVIENAAIDAESNLIVTVQNRGSGRIEGNQIRLQVTNSLGLERIFVGYISSDGLYPWESAPIRIASSGLTDLFSTYEGRIGLTLTIDPTDEIVEADETNNRFAFGEGPGRVRVIWSGFDFSEIEEHLGGYTYTGLSVTYYPVEDEHNYDYFHARVYVEDGVESRLVSQFDIACTVVRGIEYGGYQHRCLGHVDEHNPTDEFYLANGEGVRITLNGEIYDDDAELSGSRETPFDMGTMTFYFEADALASRAGCRDQHPMGVHQRLYTYPSGFSIPWYAAFTLCAVTE
jgi:hypothetical protein